MRLVRRKEEPMQIFVKNLKGVTTTYEVMGSSLVLELKQKIQAKEGIHPEEQRLILGGKQIEEERTFDDQKI